jgi:flagellar protein FlgJ
MVSLQDLTPINSEIFQFRSKPDPVKRAGEFEGILRAEMTRRVEKTRHTNQGQNRREGVEGLSDKKLLDVCYEMESLFIGQMLKTMRQGLGENDLFGKSMARDIFNDMLYDEYARLMAQSDQFGLARQIYKQVRER